MRWKHATSSCSARTRGSSWRIRSRAHREGARVDAGGRTWWGNCAWDGFGIVHALGLADATITAQGIAVRTTDGVPSDSGAIFGVAVPAAHWWDDIAHT